MLDEKEIIETLENLAVDKYIDERKLEEKDVEAIINIIVLYRQEKEKNKKIENELEKHIKFCEQKAEGSLNNEICHISLKFNKRLLDIINEEE